MQERELHYLLDILISARLALRYLSGTSWTAFGEDTQLQDAVVRRLEIIGEASRRISDSTHQEIPQIPWRRIIGIPLPHPLPHPLPKPTTIRYPIRCPNRPPSVTPSAAQTDHHPLPKPTTIRCPNRPPSAANPCLL